jgi:hypothetical protein
MNYTKNKESFTQCVGDYVCQMNKCIFDSNNNLDAVIYTDISECMQKCDKRIIQNEDNSLSSVNTMELSSGPGGTCNNCSLVASTRWNFPKMFAALDVSKESINQISCTFSAEIIVELPQLWQFDNDSPFCNINSKAVECAQNTENKTILQLTAEDILVLMRPQSSYNITTLPVSTRFLPSEFQEENRILFTFTSTGCLSNFNNDVNQFVELELISNSYKIVGHFSNLEMTASRTDILSLTPITMTFRNGALLRAGSWFMLRTAVADEAKFGECIKDVSAAWMLYKGEETNLELSVGPSNITFTIPSSFKGTIENGDEISITVENFRNKESGEDSLQKAYLSAYVDLTLAVDNSPILFYKVKPAGRSLKPSPLDIISVVLFGLCFVASSIIIRWHGLPLTLSTLYTDMVAVAALFSFATGCGGSLVWLFHPSQSIIYWSAAQYFFNSAMIFSLCFHWMTVLSFKCFKKLSFKSPVVLAYFFVNGCVLAFVVACTLFYRNKLHCVFDEEALTCSTEEECSKSVPANGKEVRTAVTNCEMSTFYLALGTGFIIYTFLLMVLSCMVMGRGRSLMLNEDSQDQLIRKSLTIFYFIIATTCVLYISAQVIFIAQFTSKSDQLSDLVWYIFIVWLPQCLPPLLLLFLQWNPSTENSIRQSEMHLGMAEEDGISYMVGASKEDVFNLTPRSSNSSPNMPYSKLRRQRYSLRESVLNSEDPGNKLRLVVRLKLPASFDRACFVSLDYFASKEVISGSDSFRTLCREAPWKFVGTTERVSAYDENNRDDNSRFSTASVATAIATTSSTHAIFPFVAVLEVPVVGPASNTLLRFMVHASTIGKKASGSTFFDRSSSLNEEGTRSSISSQQMSYQMTMFQPFCEFLTSSQAVLDAAASGQPLHVYASDETTCSVLDEDGQGLQSEIETLLKGNIRNAELSVQTVMMPGEAPMKDDMSSHKNIGNLIRFFQYDSEDGSSGLVVEDLQESVYANAIPRQLLELIAAERHEQIEEARSDLNHFLNLKKDKSNRGFYGNLIGQIQDEGDTAIAREWLEMRLKKRKEYVSLLRKNIQLLVNRDKHKLYFKASVEKKSDDLRFVPINLHIQDLLIGPTSAFINEEKRRSSKSVSTYEFTTVGAMAAHCYKFNKGGILSYQNRLQKMRDKISDNDYDLMKWPEELRQYDDLQWDLQLRMDCCLAQAMAALTASFVRKVEIAIQNPDVQKGEDILRQLSILGFLYQVESLLSTHGKEIGMIEDMAGAIAQLSSVAFVIQDVKDRPTNRFSFRVSRKKDSNDDAAVVKVSVSQKKAKDMTASSKGSNLKYLVLIQVVTGEVELPDRLAGGGEISVTPVLFTQGINEMQTIANNTERAKTELQDMININNLRPLKTFCDKYCRLAVALVSL